MFERFTEKAIKTIMLAQEEARRLGHNFVGTEQILLGLIGEGTGIAAKTLKAKGINLKDARVQVEKIIGRGAGFVSVEIPFTPRAKKVLELAWDEARQLGHNYIGTEHLLLGIIWENGGVAIRTLENMNVDLKPIRAEVIQFISEAAQSTNVNNDKSKLYTVEEENELIKTNKEILAILLDNAPSEIASTASRLAQVRCEKTSAIKSQKFGKAANLREEETQLVETLKDFRINNSQIQSSDIELPAIDKLTDSLLKVILLARKECRQLGHNKLGTEQFLLALIEENNGITGKVFNQPDLIWKRQGWLEKLLSAKV